VSDILKYVQDPDEAVRVESFRSLGALADQKDIPTLVQLMVKAKEGRELQAAEQAVQMACSKVKGEGRKLEPLMTALNTAGVQEKAVLLHCLGRLGGDKALDTVRAAVKDSDEKVQEAAIRALADWTDDGALPDLKNLSTTAPKDNLKIIALRGYVRLVASPVNVKKSGGKTAKTLGEAMQLATRPDEKKMILGAIGGIADLAALQIAEKCIADDTLKNEAQLACIKIAQSFKPGKAKDQALEVVATIEETAKDENVKKRAKAAIQGFTRKAKKK
jgi:HEAT repeat protein